MTEDVEFETFHAGPLYCLREKRDMLNRKVNGLMKCPPRLFVTHYNYKQNEVRGVEIDWAAAEVLAPKRFATICRKLKKARDRDWDAYEGRMKWNTTRA